MCDGVHVAEQVVLKLEAEGDEMGLFAIFDTWVLQNSQRRWLWKLDYYGQRLREIGKLSFSERLASYKRVAQSKVQPVGAKPTRTKWSQRTASGVQVHEVEVSHLEILREPHIRIFVKDFSDRMARVGAHPFRQVSVEEV